MRGEAYMEHEDEQARVGKRPISGGKTRELADDLLLMRARRLRTPRAAGVAGIIFTALLVASVVLASRAPANLSDAETVRWFKDYSEASLVITGLYLVPFAGIAFLWFIAAVRDRIGRFEDRFFSTAFLGSGLLFIAMVFAGMAAAGSLVAGSRFFEGMEYPDADLIRSVRMVSYTFIYVYAAKMAGAFVLVCNAIAFRTRVFSRWVAIAGYVAGLMLLFNFGYFEPVVTVFPAWVLFLSIYLLVTASRAKVVEESAEET